MSKSWTGPLVTGLIVAGVGAVLVANLQRHGVSGPPRKDAGPDQPAATGRPAGAKERPIGDPVVRNHVQVAAVYLADVTMDGMDAASVGAPLIHLEADVKATEGNPNGFAKDEFVPYLKVAYSVVPASGGAAIDRGELAPMVARDGLHYGANIAMPKAGDYRLVFDIRPPSAGGLGRHSDPATGVAPWWEPFAATFEWNVESAAPAAALAGAR